MKWTTKNYRFFSFFFPIYIFIFIFCVPPAMGICCGLLWASSDTFYIASHRQFRNMSTRELQVFCYDCKTCHANMRLSQRPKLLCLSFFIFFFILLFFFLLHCSSSYPAASRRCLTCEIQEFRTSSPSARLVPGRQPQLCSALSSAVEKELKNRLTRSKNIDIITPLFSPTNQRPGSDDSIIDSQITIEPSWGIVGNRSNKLRKHHLKNRLSFCLTLDATAHTGLHPMSINWNSMAVLVYVISIKFEANKAIGLDRFSTWS